MVWYLGQNQSVNENLFKVSNRDIRATTKEGVLMFLLLASITYSFIGQSFTVNNRLHFHAKK